MTIHLDDFKIKVENAKSTRKCYRMTCNRCSKDRGYKRKSRYGLGLCRSCASIEIHTGKVVSDETKIKMKQNHHLNNGGLHSGFGKHHSDATKLILSEKQIKYCKEYGNQFKGHKHSNELISRLSILNSGKEPKWKGRVFQYNGSKGSFKMRSSYELAYANWMDNKSIEWQYEPQFKLKNGKIFSPDFQLKHGDIIEIKGYWTKIGLEKWTMFCEEYPEINKKVLMKQDLLQLGLEIN